MLTSDFILWDKWDKYFYAHMYITPFLFPLIPGQKVKRTSTVWRC